MAIGLVGRKCGMTQVYTEEGSVVAVTVIEALPNRVVQVKTNATDGYNALQITTGTRRASRVTKALAGHYAKASVEPGRGLWEFLLDDQTSDQITAGSELKVDVFQVGQMVDVTGTSKGKGFAGTVKRHHFATQDATHGNSLSHRVPGSIGQRQSPGRVFKGKKMSGQMGNKRCTIQSQLIVKIDAEKNLLLIKGVVPGAPGSDVIILPAVRQKTKKQQDAK